MFLESKYSTFKRPKALFTTVSGDLKYHDVCWTECFSKLRILSLMYKMLTYIVFQMKKKQLYVFLFCVKYKIVFKLIYDSLKQTLD